MATQLVVLASNGRRATVRTSPSKSLSDVLQDACSTLRLNPDQYTLKHKSKPLDLSLTVRLANLPNHAQLELIQSSRSPAVVSVALQLPQADGNTRLTGKFPSTTSLWQILRRFESGAAGSGSGNPSPNLNFTQRAVPQVSNGAATGGGRLFYEMPVIHLMGRDLSSFTDLQKTLAQLGLNGGSALLRLNFRSSEQPLEEAMASISQYFESSEDKGRQDTDAHGAHSHNVGAESSAPDPDEGPEPEAVDGSEAPPEPTPMEGTIDTPETATAAEGPSESTELMPTSGGTETDVVPENTVVGPDQRPISIFAPPSSSTPQAANAPFNPADYETTVEAARLHQARLAEGGRNKRLPSDKELAEQEIAKQARLASIREVTIRVRLPDQSQVQGVFNNLDTTGSLYQFVRDVLGPSGHPFSLRYVGAKGQQVPMKDGTERLIGDLHLQGRVLVNFVWDERVGLEVRKQPILKEEYQGKAQQIKVELPEQVPVDRKTPVPDRDQGGSDQANKESSSGPDKETKLKKFLGRLSKK